MHGLFMVSCAALCLFSVGHAYVWFRNAYLCLCVCWLAVGDVCLVVLMCTCVCGVACLRVCLFNCVDVCVCVYVFMFVYV